MKRITAALALMTATASAQDVRQGLISYWPLDATDGTVTADIASGLDLSLVNMDNTNFVPGQRGNCAAFDGSSEILVRDTLTNLNPGLPLYANQRFTICMWVKGIGSAQANDRRIFAEGSTASGNPIYNIGTYNLSNQADIFVRSASATLVNHARTTQLPLDGTWHHIALTDNNGTLRMYVDGVPDPLAVTYTRGTLTLDRLAIGGLQRAAASNFFTGEIDDVALWSRILTEAEILDVKNNGLATPIPPLVSVAPAGPYAEGDRVALTVRAYGAGPFTYQWRRNGNPVPNATDTVLVIPSLTSTSDGTYDVLINGTPSAATVLSYTPDPAPSLATDIVSWWPLNALDTNTVPATTPDPWSGNTINCEAMDANSVVPGMFGNALRFDAALFQYGQRTTGFPIFNNPAYSVAFWVKGDGTTQADLRVFSEGSTASGTPLFTLGTTTPVSQNMRVYIRSDTNVTAALASTSVVFDDQWHHVAWVDTNGTAKLYIDGVQDATSFNYSRAGLTWTLNQTAIGGVVRAMASHWFTGAMDDVAVWNRALTWTEIQALRTTGVPAPVAAVPAEITTHPASRTLYQGRTLVLNVQATGTAPLSFQWFRNGDPVMDATTAEYTVPNAQPEDSGTYTCRVSNTAGNDLSDPGMVTVIPVTGLSTGLLSGWGLDTAAATTPDRVSGFDFTVAAAMDAGMALTPGQINGGLLFDGVDDLLVRPRTGTGNDVPVSNLPEFSVGFWVNGTGIGQSDRRIFSESSTVSSNPLFNIGTDATGASNSISIYIRDDSGTVRSAHPNSIAQPLDGTWHHFLWTDINGQAQMYVDGVADTAVTYNRTARTLNTTTAGGILRATPSHWFAGSIDEICTWSRALSADEAMLLYQIGTGQAVSVTGTEILPGGKLRLSVTTQFGTRPYQVQETSDISAGPWTTVPDVTLSPVASGVFTAEFTVPPAGTRRYYRVSAPW